MKDIQSKNKNIYENRKFFKGYIKIVKRQLQKVIRFSVKSVVKKVITRAKPGRSLVKYE